jgi:hypothetical protein
MLMSRQSEGEPPRHAGACVRLKAETAHRIMRLRKTFPAPF